MNYWNEKVLQKKPITNKVTIQVDIYIEGKERILNLGEVQSILEETKVIAVSNCSCREKVQRCSAPLDVCFSVNGRAQEFVDKGLAKIVTLKAALDALRRSQEAGLVHVTLTLTGGEMSDVICSCCSCCCQSLGVLIGFGRLDAIVASKYVANHNSAACINCGICISRCQFKANRIEEDKMVKFDPKRCFGCGVCVNTCPTNSISLIAREKSSEYSNR